MDEHKDHETPHEESTPDLKVSHAETPHVHKGKKPGFNKKWLFLLVPVVLFASFAGFKILFGGKNDDTNKQAPADYSFLTMEQCNKDMQEKYGMSVANANDECQRLEKELIAGQSGDDFEPFPLECTTNVPDTQWYRTDDTFVVDYKNPDTMYVNVERKGFYKTTDGGKTWTLKTKGIVVDHKDATTGKPCYGEYPVAIMDPTNNNRILLATSGGGGGTIKDLNMRGGGVYETTDGAETWTQKINTSMNGYTTHALVFNPKNPQAFMYGTASSPASYTEADPNKIWVTKGLIYSTKDNGKNWEELPTGFVKNTRLTAIMIDPNNPDKITAATAVIIRNATGPNTISDEQTGIIQTTDGGATWKRIDNLPAGHQASYQTKMSPANPEQMYTISLTNADQGFKAKNFYSNDGGKTWNESSKVMDTFAYTKTGKLIGHQWQGVNTKVLYQSTDNGKTWTAFGTLPGEVKDLNDKKTRIIHIAFHPTDTNTFYLTGANGYVWRTTDNGATWTVLLSVDKLPQ